MEEEHLERLVYAILSEDLRGYTLKRDVELEGSITNKVPVVATLGDAHKVFKRIFVQCSVGTLVREEVETHSLLLSDLKKRKYFSEPDEYWLVNYGHVDRSLEKLAAQNKIVVCDKDWVSEKLKTYLETSKGVRSVYYTLKAAGVAL